MSQPCRLISWSMAFHSSGPKELNCSPTAEQRLLLTESTTWRTNRVLGNNHTKLHIFHFMGPFESQKNVWITWPNKSNIVVWTENFILRYIITNKLNVEFPACTATWINFLLFAEFLKKCCCCFVITVICFSPFLRIVSSVEVHIQPFQSTSKISLFLKDDMKKQRLIYCITNCSCRYLYKVIGGFFFYILQFVNKLKLTKKEYYLGQLRQSFRELINLIA